MTGLCIAALLGQPAIDSVLIIAES